MILIMIELELDPFFENVLKPVSVICPKWVNHWMFYRSSQGAYMFFCFVTAAELYGTIFFIVLNLSCLHFWLRVEFTVLDSKDLNGKHKST